MKRLIAGWMIVTCILVPLTARAAEDPLKEMDLLLEQGTEQDKQPTAPEDLSLAAQAVSRMALDLTLKTDLYLNSVPDRDDSEAQATLDFQTWAGTGSSSLHLEGWAEYGSQDHTYAGITPLFRDDSRNRRILEVSQLYWLLDKNNMALTLGKKQVPANTNCIAPLSQVYHSLDLNVPPDPRVFGVWQAELDARLGKTTHLTARVFPSFQDHKIPGASSRWMPDGRAQSFWYPVYPATPELDFITAFILYYFGDIIQASPFLQSLFSLPNLQAAGKTLVMENDLPGTNAEDAGYSALVRTELGNMDLFASVFRGPNPFPLLFVEDRGSVVAMIKKNPLVYRAAAGGSLTRGNVEIHTEMLHNIADGGTDDNYLAYTGGITLTDEWTARLLRLDQVLWRVDYAGETVTRAQRASGYYFSSRVIRPFTNDVLAHLLLQVNADTRIYYKTDINFDRDALFHRIGGSYRIRPGLVVEAFADVFDGDKDSFYGQWKDNDRICCLLKWSF